MYAIYFLYLLTSNLDSFAARYMTAMAIISGSHCRHRVVHRLSFTNVHDIWTILCSLASSPLSFLANWNGRIYNTILWRFSLQLKEYNCMQYFIEMSKTYLPWWWIDMGDRLVDQTWSFEEELAQGPLSLPAGQVRMSRIVCHSSRFEQCEQYHGIF